MEFKRLGRWQHKEQLATNGFFTVLRGNAFLRFCQEGEQHYLSVGLEPDRSSVYVASRVTEVDSRPAQPDQILPWQPVPGRPLVARYTIRFTQATTPRLTENAMLWNAPFRGQGNRTITAAGITRNPTYGGYIALIAQAFDLATGSGLLLTTPVPTWLDPVRWHEVAVIVGVQEALVSLSQDGQPHIPVARHVLDRPPEPLAFEFSVDNEIYPGYYAPVTIADAIDVAALEIGYRPP